MASYKLLLADDSLTIQKVVELVLADERFKIKAVGDGELALAALESFKPDIILADIDMPKMNGYQLCEKIKNSTATVHIPVILLAGAFEPFDETYARTVGADDFIIKPFESQELISKVKSLLVGVQPSAAEPSAATGVQEVEELSVSEEPGLAEEITITEEDTNEYKEMTREAFHAGFEDELAQAIKTEPSINLEVPSSEDIREIVRQSVERKVSDMFNGDNMAELAAAVKEVVSSALAQHAAIIIQDVTKELVAEMLESLHSEITAAIGRIVPQVAETIIKKEIERITAQS